VNEQILTSAISKSMRRRNAIVLIKSLVVAVPMMDLEIAQVNIEPRIRLFGRFGLGRFRIQQQRRVAILFLCPLCLLLLALFLLGDFTTPPGLGAVKVSFEFIP
jgi:hypothetical protein